jgi:integrase
LATERKQKTYYIRKPGYSGRATFAIREKGPTGDRALDHESLKAINKQYLNKLITYDEALAKVREIVIGLLKSKNDWNEKNLELVEQFWEDRYADKRIKRPETARARIRRAVQVLGALSLLTATKKEITEKIKDHPEQRRIASTLNTLLKWSGRDILITRQIKSRRVKVKALTTTEITTLIKQLKDPNFKLLFITAFATGARLGECFALDPKKLIKVKNKAYVNVTEQLLLDGSPDDTKTGGTRRAPVMRKYLKDVEEWCALPEAEKLKVRKWKHGALVRALCKKIWPQDKDKWIRFHDLRHCYAIYLLSRGATMAQVAGALGNSVGVCQEHYVGYELVDASLDSLMQII